MTRFRTFKYYLTEAFRSILRNKVMSLSSAATVSACIFIVVLSYCIAINVNSIMRNLETGIDISVFLDDSLGSEQVNNLYLKIMEIPHVIEASFISSEQALMNFIGDDVERFESLIKINPLRRSFIVVIDDASNFPSVIERLKSSEMAEAGIANVSRTEEFKDFVDILTSINNVVRIISIIVIFGLGTLSVVIITNTVKLTIDNRQEEISIMKYIGSTDWFVRWPFLIEGFILGLLGSVMPLLIFILSYDRLIAILVEKNLFLGDLLVFLPGSEIFTVLTPIVILIGGAIGTFASVTTIRKYLDV